jgi:hypothetical protein
LLWRGAVVLSFLLGAWNFSLELIWTISHSLGPVLPDVLQKHLGQIPKPWEQGQQKWLLVQGWQFLIQDFGFRNITFLQVYYFSFWDKVSLCNSGLPWTHVLPVLTS